jgi:hypothetical protein
MKNTHYDLRNVSVLCDRPRWPRHGESKKNWNASCSGPPAIILEADPWMTVCMNTHTQFVDMCGPLPLLVSSITFLGRKFLPLTIDIVMDLKSFPDQPGLVSFWSYPLDGTWTSINGASCGTGHATAVNCHTCNLARYNGTLSIGTAACNT